MNKTKIKFLITNFITLLRVIGIFALIPIYISYGGTTTFILSSLCFLTDFIDGYLARTLNSSTFFGSLFDALSDKAFLIINMILLMSISPYAIILVIFELTIAFIQSIKYSIGLNIKSNMHGKIKMWIAGIVISLTYLLTDYISNYELLLIPLYISEIITIVSYLLEYKHAQKNKQIINETKEKDEQLLKEISNISLKEIMFNHNYYEKYKDYGNLKLIKSLTKKKV